MKKNNIIRFSAIVFTALVIVPTQAQQIFDIDSSFGSHGRKLLQRAEGNTSLYDVHRQTDGKVISSGQIKNFDYDLFLFRNNADGTIDNSFGNNGKVSWDIAGDEGINAMALQSDGKIVGCGWQQNNNTYKAIMVRMNTNGTPDNSFGTQGVISFSTISGVTMNGATFRNIKIQPDGKILVAGIGYHNAGHKGIIQRYNTNGTLDNSFGTSGTVTLQFETGSHNYAEDIAIQNDGKIVVLGYSSFTSYKIQLARLNTNGTLDAGFGTNGKTTPFFGGFTSSSPSWITVLPDGRIQGLGYAYNGSQYKIISFRLNATGQFDSNFGTNGVAQFAASTNNNYAWDAHLDVNNNLFAAVEYYNSSVTDIAAILKLDSTGNAVSSFGTNGFSAFGTQDAGFSSAIDNHNDSFYLAGAMIDNNKFNAEGYVLKADASGNVMSNFGLNSAGSGLSNTTAQNIFHLPSGNILVVGMNENGDNDIMMMKYDKDGNPISSFGTAGVININNRINDLINDVVYLNNHTIAVIAETGNHTLNFSSLGSFSGPEHYTVTIIDTNGLVVAGPFDGTFDATEFPKAPSLAVDNNGKYYVLGRSAEPVNFTLYIARHLSSFALDNSFSNNGKKNYIGGTANSLSYAHLSNLIISDDNKAIFVENPVYPRVIKLDNSGSNDNSFGTGGGYFLTDTIGGGVAVSFLTKGHTSYYLGYFKAGTAKIASINFDGTHNASFATNAIGQGNQMRLFEMPDSSLMVIVKNDTTYTIKHLLKDGSIDNSFNNNTGAIITSPFSESQLLADWAVTPDTNIYLFHQFRSSVNNKLTHVGISKISPKHLQQPNTIKDVYQNIDLTISPNPFINKVNLQFDAQNIDVKQFSYQLFDITGKAIPIQPEYLQNGKVSIDNLQHLPSGNYILTITDFKSNYYNIKLVKQ